MELSRPTRHRAPWRIHLAVWIGIVLLLASVGVAAVSLRIHAGDGESRSAAETAEEKQDWVALGHVDVEGGVTPLYPQQLGQVKSVEARENVRVEAGAPLLHLDDTQAAMQVEEAEIALAAAKDQLAQAEGLARQLQKKAGAQKQAIVIARKDAELARIKRDHLKRLDKRDLAGSPTELEAAETMFQKAEAAVKAEEEKLAALEALDSQAGVRLARRDVERKKVLVRRATKARDDCVLRAPSAGVPLRVLVSAGETLGPNPRQAAIQFRPDGPFVVRADVDQEFAGRVKERQTVSILDNVTGERITTGQVERKAGWYTQRRSILQEPLQFNDVRTLECLIKLDPSTYNLRIGQRVRVKFGPQP